MSKFEEKLGGTQPDSGTTQPGAIAPGEGLPAHTADTHTPPPQLYGYVAEFEDEHELLHAAQRTRQAGTGGIRNRIDIVERRLRLFEYPLQQRHQTTDMIPRSQFRHDATIGFMHGNLGVNRMSQQATTGIVKRDTGFVARGFNT